MGHRRRETGASSGLNTRDPDSTPTEPQTVFRRLDIPPSASYAQMGYTYKLIAAAWETTYVVLSRPGKSDVLVSMGGNDFGALGVGGSTSIPGVPRVVNLDALFASSPEEGTEARTIWIQSLHAGPRHVILQLHTVTSDAGPSPPILVGWGASRHGQLGQNIEARFTSRPTRVPINIQDDQMVSCALGNQHTVVLHESGRMSVLGSNKQGQLPLSRPWESIQGLGCTWNGTYMLPTDGHKRTLLAMGNNAQGQLGRGNRTESTSTAMEGVTLPADHAISTFACGSEHVLTVMHGSPSKEYCPSVWGWGLERAWKSGSWNFGKCWTSDATLAEGQT
ncbi:regulator of chromosome condensation 1/beta-lactamase-inhibitor protein II [Melanogaster broomeanus]|nr:regulator of chromosome condensation 1/beta-lactamase-inhibitor protein II [Melanogaster broomeanus]